MLKTAAISADIVGATLKNLEHDIKRYNNACVDNLHFYNRIQGQLFVFYSLGVIDYRDYYYDNKTNKFIIVRYQYV